jgi:hypothetical protein
MKTTEYGETKARAKPARSEWQQATSMLKGSPFILKERTLRIRTLVPPRRPYIQASTQTIDNNRPSRARHLQALGTSSLPPMSTIAVFI